MSVDATGWVAKAFTGVGERFQQLIDTGEEAGGGVAVWYDGQLVVDLVGGWQDSRRTTPWTPSTVVQVFSAGKPLVAYAALCAVADGLLRLDEPIAALVPELNDPSRQVTVRRILDHTAGFPAFPAAASSLAPTDGDPLLDSLWAAGPETPPGEVLAEHALTYGHLIDGVLAAVEAPSIRTCARQLATELGCRFEFGLCPDQHHRIADVTIIDPEWVEPYLAHELGRRALTRPPGLLTPSTLNSPSYRATSFPAIGLHTNASSLAAFYNDLARPNGHIETRLGHDIHHEYLTAQSTGFDHFLRENATWSLGFRLDDDEIGMGGIGGSAGWHSPQLNYSMAYTSRGLGTFDRLEQLAETTESIIAGRRR